MEYTLLGLGILFLGLGFWAAQRENRFADVREMKVLAQELAQAKKDLEALLVHMDKASEAAVNQLEDRISQALALIEEYDRIHQRMHKVYTLPLPRSQENPGQPVLKEPLQEPKPPGTEKRQVIYRLAEEGLTVEEIAKRAQVGKGEVALILEMKNRGAK